MFDLMISPESYYEQKLKGKSEKEIRTIIRGLKNEIGHLKNIMEHPNYGNQPISHPSEAVRIWCDRMYLECAKQTLHEIGAVYTPAQAELKAMRFQENIENIREIRLEIGGYFTGYCQYTISIEDDQIHYDVEHSLMLQPVKMLNADDYSMTKDELFEGLRELHIGEWLHKYDPERFGYMYLDGTQGTMDIEYSNGMKAAHYYGNNSYPYNFDKLAELLRIDNTDCEIEEE